MKELRMLTRVRISAEGLGACVGRIEDIRQPSELPDVPDVTPPRAMLEEWGVTRFATISYHNYPGQEVMFAALEIAGRWFDLHRRELTLEVIGQYQWPQSA